ncbi:MAG: tetratricopeptide repeat protein [Candidatus Omnitrophica bacterium]|nr:tetratricopeptide repeat protein [Candidatus Omnitrophota bacterium]
MTLEKRGRGLVAVAVVALLCVAADLAAQDDVWQRKEDKLSQAQRHYDAGKRHMQEGNYTAANAEFNRVELLLQDAQGIYPEPPQETPAPEEYVPVDEKEKKRMEHALSYYLQELKKETNNPDYYYNLGIEYLINGQFAQAEEAFKLVVNLNPLDKDACYNLGILYENYLGNRDKALKYYQQYTNIAPDAPDAGTVRGWIANLTEGKQR